MVQTRRPAPPRPATSLPGVPRAWLPLRPLMFWPIQDGGAGVRGSALYDPEGAGVPDPQGGVCGRGAPAPGGGRGPCVCGGRGAVSSRGEGDRARPGAPGGGRGLRGRAPWVRGPGACGRRVWRVAVRAPVCPQGLCDSAGGASAWRPASPSRTRLWPLLPITTANTSVTILALGCLVTLEAGVSGAWGRRRPSRVPNATGRWCPAVLPEAYVRRC